MEFDTDRLTNRGGHSLWVRISHWLIAISFLVLVGSGYVILMSHPRLYWGNAGNDLTKPLIELPISRNYKHGGWENNISFVGSGVSSATRTYDIFNKNGWGRSLHFLAAWIISFGLAGYAFLGMVSGHVRNKLLPGLRELRVSNFIGELRAHIVLNVRKASGAANYGLLQKLTYVGVMFMALPLMLITGLAMSPAATAAVPFLGRLFGGHQSCRTLHFAGFALLLAFLGVHIAMVCISGLARQLRGITIGRSDD